MPCIANRFFDDRDFLHFVVEHDRQVVADMRGRESVELAATFAGENEAHARLPIFVRASVRAVRRSRPVTAEAREIRYQLFAVSAVRASRCSCPASAPHPEATRHHAPASACSWLGYGPPSDLLDLQHRRGLHDFLHARRIVHARQLHQNLVLPEPVLLDDRLAHAQRVDAVADGLDRLRDGAILQVRQALRPSSKRSRNFPRPRWRRTPAAGRQRCS